jgi:WD40 repeat protein
VAFSPDGTLLVTGGIAKTVQVWQTATLKALRPLKGIKDFPFGVDFSPDGRLIAVTSAGNDAPIRWWEMPSGKALRVPPVAGATSGSVTFSPDGALVASGGTDKTVRIWETASGTEKFTLTGHGESVGAVAFSPTQRLLATAGTDANIRLWH